MTKAGVTEAVLSIGISGIGSQFAVGDYPGGGLASSGLAGAEHFSTGRTHSLRRRLVGIDQLSNRRRRWRPTMSTTLDSVVTKYLRSDSPAQRTREEYATTLRKWSRWGGAVPLERLGRKEIREFLDWVHEDAAGRQGSNPGRTANKVRSHLGAVLSWAWEYDLIDSLPRFPRLKPQRDVAGRHYLTKPESNALYFATHQIIRPRGWSHPWSVGRYWRCALVVFFNYGVDTGTVWETLPFHEPIRWRHISWGRQSPDREIKAPCPWGWLYYRRVKTQKAFWRPMNRTVQLHFKSLLPEHPDPDAPVFHGGGTRPNNRFRQLCQLAGVGPKRSMESGEERPWVLKDLRKTCATYYDEHVPESSVEILGHSAGGITYRHYAHRAPLAFRAILSLPQPSAFTTLHARSKTDAPAATGSSPKMEPDRGKAECHRTPTVGFSFWPRLREHLVY